MNSTFAKTITVTAVSMCALAIAIALAFSPAALSPHDPASSTGAVQEGQPNQATQPNQAAQAAQDPAQPAASAEQAPRASYQPGYVLASLSDKTTPDQALDVLKANPDLAGIAIDSVSESFVKFAIPSSIDANRAAALITSTGAVASAQPNRYYYISEGSTNPATSTSDASGASGASGGPASSPGLLAAAAMTVQSVINDPFYPLQWNLESINAPQAWDKISTSNFAAPASSITIAIIDSGFRITHNDLKANIAATYDATTGKATIKPDNQSDVSVDHGTHVAGIVAAQTNNALGIAGATNNNCRVLPIRIEDKNGDITTEYLLKAYEFLTAKVTEHNIRVANISLAGGAEGPVDGMTDPLLYEAIGIARNAGIVSVASACNESNLEKLPFYVYPSDYDNVISVINLEKASASHEALTGDPVVREPTSNYNKGSQRAKDISAPGERIYSLFGGSDSEYGIMGGTSMATPIVSATIGLMIVADPFLSPDEVTSKLFSTTRDINTPGWDAETGYGEADAAAAVDSSNPYLSGIAHVTAGSETQLAVMVSHVSQPASDWFWSSSDPSIASVDNGRVTAKAAGQVTVTAENGGRKAVQTVSIMQAPGDVSNLSITIPAQTYTGQRLRPIPVIRNGTIRLAVGSQFTVRYRNNLNAGTATAIITGVEPYSGFVKKTFKIKKAPIGKAKIKLNPAKPTYTGKTVKPKVTLSEVGENKSTKLKRKTDYTLKNKGTKIGNGTIKISATKKCANFTGTATKKYKVKVKATPVYSLRNPYTDQRFYTTSKAERASFASEGWIYQRVAWKAPSKSNHPVYRLSKDGDFWYTKSRAQRKRLMAQGWNYDKIAFYSDDFKTHPIYLHPGPLRYSRAKSSIKVFYSL